MMKRNDDGIQFCDTLANYLDLLMSRRDFAGAIKHFESSRALLDEVGDERAARMFLQVARAHASLTDYPSALKAARTAQAKATAGGDSLLLADIFVTLGNTLRDSGELEEAQKAFRDAESIFRRNDSLEGQCRALNLLAGLYFRKTDYRNALTVLMDAVEIARNLDDTQKLAFMMGNVGRLQTFIGDFSEAEKHLRINIDLSTELNDQLELVRALLSLGYVHNQQADYAQASETLQKAQPLIAVLNAKREEVTYLTYLGELLYRRGQYDEAGRTLKQGLAMAERTAGDTTLAGRTLRHLAELHVRTGNWRLAQKAAARAMVIMKNNDDKVEIGALTKIMAQIKTAQGKVEEATREFKRSFDLLDESGVRFEKAEALIAAGFSEVFDRRLSLTYLFRAEEFYARYHVTRRYEEVSEMIGRLGRPSTQMHSSRVAGTGGLDYLTKSRAIRRIKKQLPMLARSDLPILITGETGAGKDHLVRYFHSLARPGMPYIAVNCASVPETLLESELFGYRRGAFTGADGNKDGKFVAANGGVFLLDEIGDMPLALQAKLLGVLESRAVTPLGGNQLQKLDLLLVAATNQNLEEMVEAGRFRRDLYYRLSGISFRLPPLRERKEDIPLLLEKFMRDSGLLGPTEKPSSDLTKRFVEYDWPGNVREMQNVVKRLEVMSQLAAERNLDELAESILQVAVPQQSSGGLFDRVEQFERQLITEALLAAGGNKSEAARMLGVHEATVRTKLKRYGIEADARSAPN